MPQPYDYSLNVQSPVQAFAGGMDIGAAGLKAQQARQAMEMQKQKQIRTQNIQKAMQTFYAIPPGERTYDDYAALIQADPENASKIEEAWRAQGVEQQGHTLRLGGQVLAALHSGSVDAAQKIIEDRIAAANNTGDKAQAKSYGDILDIINLDPARASESLKLIMAALPGGKDVIESVAKVEEIRRSNAKLPGEINKQRADTIKILTDMNLSTKSISKVMNQFDDPFLQKTAGVLEGVKEGVLEPEKVADMEKDLNEKYWKRTQGIREADRVYANIESSSTDNSGASDIALVTSFMKMLDPGSVVRETEFATARDTAGLLQQLQNAATKLENGQFLNNEQRAAFVRLAKEYHAAATKEGKLAEKSLMGLIKNYGLTEENVFGVRPVESAPGTPPPAGGASQTSAQTVDEIIEKLRQEGKLPKG